MAINVQHRMNPTVESMLNAQRVYGGGAAVRPKDQAAQQTQNAQTTARSQAFNGTLNGNAQQTANAQNQGQNQAVNQDAQERRTRQQQRQDSQQTPRQNQSNGGEAPSSARLARGPQGFQGAIPQGQAFTGGQAQSADARVRGQSAYASGAEYTASRASSDGVYVVDNSSGPQLNETARAARYDQAFNTNRSEQATAFRVDPQVAEDVDTSRFAGPASYRQAIDFASRAYEAVQNRNQSLLGGHQPLALSV